MVGNNSIVVNCFVGAGHVQPGSNGGDSRVARGIRWEAPEPPVHHLKNNFKR